MSMDLVPQNQLDNQEGDEYEDEEEYEAGIDSERDMDDILPGEDADLQEGDLSARERMFLGEFPIQKQELEEGIRFLHDLANGFDRNHQIFTKTNIVTSSLGLVSAAMGIMGVVLAPATAGGSLVLSTSSQGLGAIVGVTSMLTNFLEYSHDKKVRTQASGLMPTRDQEAREAEEKAACVMAAGKAAYNCGDTIKNMKKNVRAFRMTRAHPRLTAAAKRFLITGRVSARRMKQMEKAFDGTVLLMTKNARLMSNLFAGLSLGVDAATVWNNWKELQGGARAKYAEELRARARQLQTQLTELTRYHEKLQQKLFEETTASESSLQGAMENLSLPTARPGEAGAEESNRTR
ncbi:apolipoprotein L6-like isoform X2 [Choloepus didactylus]|nr:apolipoprotein L6-like isoform X2 [Choloepus didactylus]XP_037702995.1 apolipoprotein L6-like isoform X2 [Choloepus didactylus]XP_037702996.1 apolipoprotein L6-like isoform X2 [Choloepus didactylus]